MTNIKEFAGVFTALVTPFTGGKVDIDSLGNLVQFQLKNNINGFVINGTTAESPSLSNVEVREIFNFVKSQAPHTPLVLGVGSNSTEKTVKNLKLAEELGADAVLVVVPYYNKPPQRGLIAHFTEVANKSSKPVLLYNVPGRTVVNMSTDTIVTLSRHENIIGIKEASGDMGVVKELRGLGGEDFLLTSGDDISCMQFCELGGIGVISVLSHLIPKEMVAFIGKASSGVKVSDEYKKFDRLNMALSFESNPIPVKTALFLMGIIKSPEMRLPLVELSDEYTGRLKEILVELGLVKS